MKFESEKRKTIPRRLYPRPYPDSESQKTTVRRLWSRISRRGPLGRVCSLNSLACFNGWTWSWCLEEPYLPTWHQSHYSYMCNWMPPFTYCLSGAVCPPCCCIIFKWAAFLCVEIISQKTLQTDTCTDCKLPKAYAHTKRLQKALASKPPFTQLCVKPTEKPGLKKFGDREKIKPENVNN